MQNSSRVRPADLRALRTFLGDYPEATGLLLYRGEERLRIDGVWCLPVGPFLGGLRPAAPLLAKAAS